EEFLKGAGLAMARTPVAAQTKTPQDTRSVPQADSFSRARTPLTPEDITRASQVLVAYMGPIAPVLAKRAAKPGATREQFITALAAHLADDATRARFLAALR